MEPHPYLRELVADIMTHGSIQDGQSFDDAMKDAHERRQAFALEMAAGQTDRSSKARRLLAVQIYGNALIQAEINCMDSEQADLWRREIQLSSIS